MIVTRTVLVVFALLAAACGGDSGPSAPTSLPSANVPFSATDVVAGTGTEATTGRRLTVNYTGWIYDSSRAENKGTQFDTSAGRGPYSFTLGLGQVIRGWDQGFNGMRVGGSRRLIIPPELAYGSSGTTGIPGNATLIFDVELLAVQ